MKTTHDVTVTRSAILGQLALRDWAGYELTQSVRRTLRWFWPRAESAIYAEAKRLERDGLAVSSQEPAVDGSARTRTVYRITPQGRKVIAQWLDSPTQTITVHNETLLRVHLAHFGTTANLLEAIDHAHATGTEALADAEAIAAEFVEGSHPLQHAVHVRGVLFDSLVAYGQMLHDWADQARREVADWESIEATPESRRHAIDRMQAFLDTRRKDQPTGA